MGIKDIFDNMQYNKVLDQIVSQASIYMPQVSFKAKKTSVANNIVLKGIVCGDILGSFYKNKNLKAMNPIDFNNLQLLQNTSKFSGNTVLGIAIAAATQDLSKKDNVYTIQKYEEYLRNFAREYSQAGYSHQFGKWALNDDAESYSSHDNNSAVRVGYIGAHFNSLSDVIKYAVLSAYPTHSHAQGIKGAVVTACAIWMAYHGYSKIDIMHYIASMYMQSSVIKIRPNYTLDNMANVSIGDLTDPSCDTALIEACVNINNSNSFLEAFKANLHYSSDTDSIMSITGAIIAGLYPDEIDNLWIHCQSKCAPRLINLIETL